MLIYNIYKIHYKYHRQICFKKWLDLFNLKNSTLFAVIFFRNLNKYNWIHTRNKISWEV